MSGLRRLPAIADLCCGRNETVRASFEAGSMPLDEYVRRESLKAVENAKKMYHKAVEQHAEKAYFYLALIYKNEGDTDTYRKLMLEGIEPYSLA